MVAVVVVVVAVVVVVMVVVVVADASPDFSYPMISYLFREVYDLVNFYYDPSEFHYDL